MTDNPSFPNPPIDMAELQRQVDMLSSLVAESFDGGKKVIAQKRKQRDAVINLLSLLGRYVEVASKHDPAIFQTSGFMPIFAGRSPSPSLSDTIRKLEHGRNSGQVLIWLRRNPYGLE